MKAIPTIYIHFADYYHVQRARQNLVKARDIANTISEAARIAAVFADDVYFPASSLFESSECRRIMHELPEFRAAGTLKMSAGDATVVEHLESKAASYNDNSPRDLLRAYQQRHGLTLPTYVQRDGSSTKAITAAWRLHGEQDSFIRQIRERTGCALPDAFDAKWQSVPSELNGSAFVPSHARDVLRRLGIEGALDNLIALPIESAYISGYATSLKSSIFVNVPHLSSKTLEQKISAQSKIDYEKIIRWLARLDLLEPIKEAPSSALFRFSCSSEWEAVSKLAISSPDSPELKHLAVEARAIILSQSRDYYSPSVTPQLEMVMSTDQQSDRKPSTSRPKHFDAAIVTALPIEFSSVRAVIPDMKVERIEGDPGSYQIGTFSGPRGSKSILLAMLPRMGNSAAATATTNLLRSFDVDDLVFCGIALGVPSPANIGRHVRLGDVVVSDRKGVIDLDHRAIQNDGEVNRSSLPPPPANFIRALNELESDTHLFGHPLRQILDKAIAEGPRALDAQPLFRRPDESTDIILTGDNVQVPHPADPNRHPLYPKIIRGNIGASGALVKDEAHRQKMASAHDLRAMEMEGAGVLEATWSFSRSALIVRGVCDYGVGKNDIWHPYAAIAAAAMSLALIDRL